MKVKVAHTIDMEEVPTFVNQVVETCRGLLKSQCNKLEVRWHDIPGTIGEYNKILANLSLVQDKIEDAANIIIGWEEATSTKPTNSEDKEGKDEDI
tara:strand:+ start:278 stop:565 length:288 start_codon:yes stop_codon:yes gene_type:complete